MKNAIKKLVVEFVGCTFLPIVNGCTKILNLARVQKMWGADAALCQIDASAKCYHQKNVKLHPPMVICNGATMTASGNGFIRLHQNVYIDSDVRLRTVSDGKIEIGCSTFVGNGTIIGAGERDVQIGRHVLIAHYCSIISENHVFDRLDQPIFQQGTTSRGIIIEDDVWVGARVCILDGVRIGTGSVIAAGAVVAKDVAPFSIVGGVPARLIRMRVGEHKLLNV